MCKFVNNAKHSRIDRCMKEEIEEFNKAIKLLEPYLSKKLRVCACCCGHGNYEKSIVLKKGEDSDDDVSSYFEHFSKIEIPRSRNFYKCDKGGHYYLPELNHNKKDVSYDSP